MPNYKRTKLACYTAYFTMSSIFSLPPLLFVTLHEKYDISYTLLGTLVLINFITQLAVDLTFTVFSKHFNIKLTTRIMPIMTTVGLLIYAIVPFFFEQYTYIGLVVGTVIFSIASGLGEVFLSPVIAAIPSDNPQGDMSVLHSLYGIGVLTVILVSTVFFKIFGADNWQYLTIFFALWPILAAVLFSISPMPDMNSDQEKIKSFGATKKRGIGLALCVACIFFGSCAEAAMTNWISGYMETALGIDKTVGDILGMAMFAALLVFMRLAYAKWGKSISKTLLLGMICAAACYIIAGLSINPIVAVIACVMTGLFTSMLWPGSLILMEEKIPYASVAAFALMASGGDMGASLSPQLMGIVVDKVAVSDFAADLGMKLGLSAEQIAMKSGMLVCSIFPIIGIFVLLLTLRYFKKNKMKE